MSSITPKTITTPSGQTVTIRSPEPDDAVQLIAFVHSVLAESPFLGLEPDEFDRTEDQERQWIQEHIDGPGKLVVLAEIPGEVIGCLGFENGSCRRVAHRGILAISVRENWRGQGIGTVMLQTLFDWAEATGSLPSGSLPARERRPLLTEIYADTTSWLFDSLPPSCTPAHEEYTGSCRGILNQRVSSGNWT
jgi:RimJ/RimL family protein N-acetyltransferase